MPYSTKIRSTEGLEYGFTVTNLRNMVSLTGLYFTRHGVVNMRAAFDNMLFPYLVQVEGLEASRADV